nr:uncharacterized protein LOC117276623 [Nicotiana tomentosiformis]
MATTQRKMKSPGERIHTKKRNKLTLKRFNDLVFIKYNRTLRRRYNARNIIDPISLDNIDDANEVLTGVPEDHADEEVFEKTSNITWGDVAEARRIGEKIYGLRGNISTSNSQRKGKEAAIFSLVDEEEEEDDEQYNNDSEIQEFDNLVEEYDADFVLRKKHQISSSVIDSTTPKRVARPFVALNFDSLRQNRRRYHLLLAHPLRRTDLPMATSEKI